MEKLAYFVSGLVVGFICVIVIEYHKPSKPTKIDFKAPDTVFVQVIKEVKVKEITTPTKVRIQSTPDTTFRKKLNNQKVIKGMKIDFKREVFDIQTISPKSTVVENCYDVEIPKIDYISVNDSGSVEVVYKTDKELRRERRREKFNNVIKVAVPVMAFILGLVL